MPILKPALVLFAALALTACATARLKAPHLVIVGASMTSADVFSQQFRVRVLAQNPNDRALPVKSIDYKLFLEGDSFAEGQSEAAFVVPANSEREFDLVVRTHFVSSIGRLLSRLNGTDRKEVQYVFEGSVVVDLPFSPKVKFREGGSVDLGQK